MINDVPTSISLSTLTLPFILSIKLLHILSPRPVPCLFIYSCSSSFENFWKSLSIFSLEIPVPESTIFIFKYTL